VKKGLLLLSMLFLASSMARAAVTCDPTALSPTLSATVAGVNVPTSTTVPLGSTITLYACFPGVTGITEVQFENNGTVLPGGTITAVPAGNSPYTFTWTQSTVQSLSLTAVASYPGSGSTPVVGSANGVYTGTINGPIDLVGDSVKLPSITKSPTTNSVFGEASAANSAWLPGDNQFCGIDSGRCTDQTACSLGSVCADGGICSNWPYNGFSTAFPDGQCEWNNAIDPVTASTTPTLQQSASTVDSLDDVMHTMSDFYKYASSVLGQDVGTLSGSLDSWFPQMETWTAPVCAANGSAYATGTDPTTGQACTTNPKDPNSGNCDISSSTTSSCAQGQSGRLLSIYNPAGNSAPQVDVLKDWYGAITPWLINNYTPSGATSATTWCVPALATFATATTEGTYIANNSAAPAYSYYTDTSTAVGALPATWTPTPSSTWGDLPHVISCLDYNAGQNSAISSSTINTYNNCLVTLNAMEAAKTCTFGSTGIPPGCTVATLGPPPNQAVCTLAGTTLNCTPPTPTGSASDCDIYSPGSYASWVSNAVNFGPVYNYTQCLNYVTAMNAASTCPSSPPAGSPCDPKVLGRSLLDPTQFPNPGFSCTNANYATWLNENIAIATDEAPKFALRSLFLKDIFSRAQNLQKLSYQGEQALSTFLSPNGPAAQLASAHSTHPKVTEFPNSVIYGWTDQTLPNGKTLSNGLGYAHIIKVSAYSPGRSGYPAQAAASFIQTKLPWIQTSSGFASRTYELVQRDGYVYVSVKRWDQEHKTPVAFANNHPLWQFSFNSPNPKWGRTDQTGGLPQACIVAAGSGQAKSFGLMSQTITGLNSVVKMLPKDATNLQNSFMLDDEGDGKVDANNQVTDPTTGNSVVGNTCEGGSAAAQYCDCLSAANKLLDSGVDSHACAKYVASRNASRPSGDGDADYSLEFVDCNSILKGAKPPEDMTYED